MLTFDLSAFEPKYFNPSFNANNGKIAIPVSFDKTASNPSIKLLAIDCNWLIASNTKNHDSKSARP